MHNASLGTMFQDRMESPRPAFPAKFMQGVPSVAAEVTKTGTAADNNFHNPPLATDPPAQTINSPTLHMPESTEGRLLKRVLLYSREKQRHLLVVDDQIHLSRKT